MRNDFAGGGFGFELEEGVPFFGDGQIRFECAELLGEGGHGGEFFAGGEREFRIEGGVM